MDSKEAIIAALRDTKTTRAELTAKIGWTTQKLNSKLSRDCFKADEFLTIMDALGIDVIYKLRETGKAVTERIAGAGRRVRLMVDGVIYDTASSDALANSFWADGENEYIDGRALELYIDKAGRYFFAEYMNLSLAKDHILPVTKEEADAFIQKYGTELHRGPELNN